MMSKQGSSFYDRPPDSTSAPDLHSTTVGLAFCRLGGHSDNGVKRMGVAYSFQIKVDGWHFPAGVKLPPLRRQNAILGVFHTRLWGAFAKISDPQRCKRGWRWVFSTETHAPHTSKTCLHLPHFMAILL